MAHVRAGRSSRVERGAFYFGARYFDPFKPGFLSADWADKPEAVPYSDLADPQSLNLYTYVRNNPVSRTDSNGHDGGFWDSISEFFQALVQPLSNALSSIGSSQRSLPQPRPESVDAHDVAQGLTANVAGGISAAEPAFMLADISGLGAMTKSALEHNTLGVAMGAAGLVVSVAGAGELKQLGLSLASKIQVHEAETGAGTIIAGAGSKSVFRDAAEMAAKYGGDAADYVKKSSSTIKVQGQGYVKQVETHWVQNLKTGKIYELKTKIRN